MLVFFSFPDTFIEHSLISLKRFNLFLFRPARIWDSIQFGASSERNPNHSILSNLIRILVGMLVHLPKTKGQLTHMTATRESERTRDRPFLFDFIYNSRICIVLFAELFFVDGYFFFRLAQSVYAIFFPNTHIQLSKNYIWECCYFPSFFFED